MTEPDSLILKFDGVEYDISDLTWDEVEQIEEEFDCAFAELELGRAKVLRRIVVTLAQRKNPELTAAEFGQIRYLREMVRKDNGDRPD